MMSNCCGLCLILTKGQRQKQSFATDLSSQARFGYGGGTATQHIIPIQQFSQTLIRQHYRPSHPQFLALNLQTTLPQPLRTLQTMSWSTLKNSPTLLFRRHQKRPKNQPTTKLTACVHVQHAPVPAHVFPVLAHVQAEADTK
jgi:hypothetical protein